MYKRVLAFLLAMVLLIGYLPSTAHAASEILAGGSCGENVTWCVDEDGVLTISGRGNMTDFREEDAPWRGYPVYSVIIEEGVTSVGRCSFNYYDSITSVSLPSTLISIGAYAFERCSSLKSIVLPSSLQTIYGVAFSSCKSLESVIIPDSVTRIDSLAFVGCKNLKTVQLSQNLTQMHTQLFANTVLREIEIPASVTYIGESVFSGGDFDSPMEKVTFAGSAPELSEYAFKGIVADVYYPLNDDSWDTIIQNNYGGTINWIGYVAPCKHKNLTTVPANTAFCEKSGNHLYFVCECGIVLKADGMTETTVESEMIPALGHTGGMATCGALAICSQCGQPYGDFNADNHTGGMATCNSQAVCENCGQPYGDFNADNHTGGMATCNSQAVCENCGQPYGDLDGYNHAGGTELRNVKDATTEETGYTGDTYCLGCGGQLEVGMEIPKIPEPCKHPNLIRREEQEATCEKSGNHLYFVCECGIVLKADGMTETTVESETIPALGHTGGMATCSALAICERCRLPYGDINADHHTGGMATCNSLAVCENCGQLYGDVDVKNHASGTLLLNQKEATETSVGYTGDSYCAGCGAFLSAGTLIPKLPASCKHTDLTWVEGKADTCEKSGNLPHYICACGKFFKEDGVTETTEGELIIPPAGHIGGKATCSTPAICRICKQPYDGLDADNHTGKTELRNVKIATLTEPGYTGDVHCKGCGVLLSLGKETFEILDGKKRFYTFQELQELVKKPVKEETYIYYTSKDPLVISKNITIPEDLVVVADSVTVAEGVTLTVNKFGQLDADTLTVNGTVTNRGTLHIYDTLRVNGKINNYNRVHVKSVAAVSGRKNIEQQKDSAHIHCNYSCKTVDELEVAAKASTKIDEGWLVTVMFAPEGPAVIDRNISFGKNVELEFYAPGYTNEDDDWIEYPIEIAKKGVLRLNGQNAAIFASMVVHGVLQNDAKTLRYGYSKGREIRFSNSGAYVGSGRLVITCEDTKIPHYRNILPGIDNSKIKTQKTSDGWIITCVSGYKAPSVTLSNSNRSGKPQLKWKQVNGAAKYEVWRANSKNGTYTCLSGTEDCSYGDNSATAGKTYFYKVRAVGYDGVKGTYSAIKSIACRCTVPVVKTTVSSSTGKTKLTWNKVPGAQKYAVYRVTSNGASTQLTTTKNLSCIDNSAKVGTTYSYKVKALGSKSSYNGNYSDAVKSMRICAQPDLVVKVDSMGIASLSWSKVSGAKLYNILRAESQNGEYTLVKTTTSTSYTDNTVAFDKDYWYRVEVIGSKADTDNATEGAVKVHTTCAKPSVNVKLSNKKPLISWEIVEGAVKYEVYRATSKSGKFTKVTTVIDATSYRDSKAKKGKTYYYKVRAIAENAAANSAFSSVMNIKSK